MTRVLGPFELDHVHSGDSRELIEKIPDNSIDIIVTSPPYWGQRASLGSGVEEDPRKYVEDLTEILTLLLPKLTLRGSLWLNVGDAYNTPVNWTLDDKKYSTLGPTSSGLEAQNSAYTKPRHSRKAFIENGTPWLSYGNLLALPYRLVIRLCDRGWFFRGEVIWRKKNPMPEGRARRPHRQHESIYLFTKSERHEFRTTPPVGTVWEFGTDKVPGLKHFSRFPIELPSRCIGATGMSGKDIVVFDPFCGSGSTGIAALAQGCSFLGFEIDPDHAQAANERLEMVGTYF